MTDKFIDAYDIARHVLRYTVKNGYAPRRGSLGCSTEAEDLLERNGVIEFLALYKGGPKICVALTEKGRRMTGLVR